MSRGLRTVWRANCFIATAALAKTDNLSPWVPILLAMLVASIYVAWSES